MRALFDDAEIVELGFVIAGFVMLGRLHFAFDIRSSPPELYRVLASASPEATT